jgi:hypothetical protein
MLKDKKYIYIQLELRRRHVWNQIVLVMKNINGFYLTINE